MLRRQFVAVAVSVAFLTPLIFLLLGSLWAPGDTPPDGLELIPPEPTLASFERAFDLTPLGRQLLNSMIVVAFAVPLTVLTASWAGFAMTRLRPRSRRLVIGLSLLVLMIPL